MDDRPRVPDDEERDDDDTPDETPDDAPYERPIDRFRKSATGSVVAAGLLGLRDVIEGRPEREEAAIVSEAPSQPVRDDLDVVLDPEHPERSVVYLRRPPAD
jgi:hypothetical protein